jgi:hypothetical protein
MFVKVLREDGGNYKSYTTTLPEYMRLNYEVDKPTVMPYEHFPLYVYDLDNYPKEYLKTAYGLSAVKPVIFRCDIKQYDKWYFYEMWGTIISSKSYEELTETLQDRFSKQNEFIPGVVLCEEVTIRERIDF